MRRLIPFFITIAVSLAIGTIIGRKTTPVKNSTTSAQETSSSKGSRSTRRHSSRANQEQPKNFREKLQRIEREGNTITQLGNSGDWTEFSFSVWQMTKNMSSSEVKEALEALESMDISKRASSIIQTKLLNRWATIDGPAAVEYGLADKKGSWPGQAWHTASGRWISTDYQAAELWYENNQNALTRDQQTRFEHRLLMNLAEKDFSLAFEKVKAAPILKHKRFLQALTSVAVKDEKNLTRFSDYLLSLENKELGQSVAQRLAERLMDSNPEQAKRFIEQWPGKDKSTMVTNSMYRWVSREPEKALNWQLTQYENKGTATRGLTRTISQWARRNPEAADKWLDKQSSDIDTDDIRRSSFSQLTYDNNYAEATKWASKIQDDIKRINSYRSIQRRWKEIDKEGLNRWLNTLPEADQEGIKNPKK